LRNLTAAQDKPSFEQTPWHMDAGHLQISTENSWKTMRCFDQVIAIKKNILCQNDSSVIVKYINSHYKVLGIGDENF
jgi:hypothetical protein